jgi:phage shock protein C
MTTPERPYRRLTLSTSDKMIGGVCGGIAAYFNVDPTLIRIIAVVLALVGGGGILAYLLAWIIMPKPGPAAS